MSPYPFLSKLFLLLSSFLGTPELPLSPYSTICTLALVPALGTSPVYTVTLYLPGNHNITNNGSYSITCGLKLFMPSFKCAKYNESSSMYEV